MDLKNLREEYKLSVLLESDLKPNPFEMFALWLNAALAIESRESNAMVLSTVTEDGWPNSRIVLLKEVDHGFVWFTNFNSQKGRELEKNPKASLNFWWPFQERQVRVMGTVEKIDPKVSEKYFASRPITSQAGAIASHQSNVISGREDLEKRYHELLENSDGGLKMPEDWGGYRLIPTSFEFWQGRESRLHDRIFYKLENGQSWTTGRLSP